MVVLRVDGVYKVGDEVGATVAIIDGSETEIDLCEFVDEDRTGRWELVTFVFSDFGDTRSTDGCELTDLLFRSVSGKKELTVGMKLRPSST